MHIDEFFCVGTELFLQKTYNLAQLGINSYKHRDLTNSED